MRQMYLASTLFAVVGLALLGAAHIHYGYRPGMCVSILGMFCGWASCYLGDGAEVTGIDILQKLALVFLAVVLWCAFIAFVMLVWFAQGATPFALGEGIITPATTGSWK